MIGSHQIDHSLLHPTMTDDEIRAGCEIAKRYIIATVCVKPYAVAMCSEALKGSTVGICSVIGFPHGNSTTAIKVAETMQAIHDGASEIDMVINIGKAMGGDWEFVFTDIAAVNEICINNNTLLKVIFETDYLNDSQIKRLCEICSEAKAAFVKTSSGYGFVKQPGGDYNYKGATEQVLKLMRKHSAPEVQIKAAGGIRVLDQLLRVRELGVTRCGATATETILEEARERGYS